MQSLQRLASQLTNALVHSGPNCRRMVFFSHSRGVFNVICESNSLTHEMPPRPLLVGVAISFSDLSNGTAKTLTSKLRGASVAISDSSAECSPSYALNFLHWTGTRCQSRAPPPWAQARSKGGTLVEACHVSPAGEHKNALSARLATHKKNNNQYQ